ncbi:MAG: hypothetical protein ABI807_09290 [Sporichthyaceae bacterium]
MTAGDGPDHGRGFLRDMAAQSARAHEFDRRLRWSRLSKRLRGDDEVVAHVSADPDDPGETGPPDVVGTVDAPAVDRSDPARSSAAPEVPDHRR